MFTNPLVSIIMVLNKTSGLFMFDVKYLENLCNTHFFVMRTYFTDDGSEVVNIWRNKPNPCKSRGGRFENLTDERRLGYIDPIVTFHEITKWQYKPYYNVEIFKDEESFKRKYPELFI